jgi:hypothetical protein
MWNLFHSVLHIKEISKQIVTFQKSVLAHPYVVKVGTMRSAVHGWNIGTQAALIPTSAKAAKVASRRPMQTLHARSLHSTDHRFAMICSGRDDRVGEI